jgi:EAL domain-containing protein (putative c-di-GMP-specific phosphodiesterase class I)
MQISINFTEDEAQAFKNWSGQVRPIELDLDTFYKQIFFNGIGAINEKLATMAQESLSNPEVRQKLKESGVDVEQLEKEILESQQSSPPAAT